MADRARVAPARKRARAKRPAKKKRTRRLGVLALAGLAALILGFLAKRIMIPSAVHYLAYRPPDQSQPMKEANPPAATEGQGGANDSSAANAKSNAGAQSGSEQLTPSDRGELDAIIKGKAK
ncbi:MAG: hypothetical protein WCA22_23945 [Candidatus Binatus sp.]